MEEKKKNTLGENLTKLTKVVVELEKIGGYELSINTINDTGNSFNLSVKLK